MTAGLALAARLLLALVFAVAGIAKVRDRAGTRAALEGFAVPGVFVRTLAVVVPLAELTVTVLLVPAETAATGALGALLLLGVFAAAIAWNLAHGRAPECHCFGQLHSAPASLRTLARNAALLGVAGVALVGSVIEPPVSAVAWLAALSGAELLALAFAATTAVVIALGGAAFISLLRSYGRVLNRLGRVEAALANAGIPVDDELELPEIGLAPGTPMPFFAGTAVEGELVSRDTIAASGIPTLLLFTSPRCGPCAALLPSVAAWQQEHGERLSVVVASSGSEEEVREDARRHGLERVLRDGDNRLYELFQANGTPSAVLAAPDGTIASWVASGAELIEHLVGQVVGANVDEDVLAVGAEAPALELQSLTGETVSLGSLRGRKSVLLFWNPDCGFCRSMHDEVLAWEASASGVAPRLVVVSSGDVETTRAEGFRSLVLLDEDVAAGAAFSANGTPMAVLVDADGRIASPVVAGSEAVLALANGQR